MYEMYTTFCEKFGFQIIKEAKVTEIDITEAGTQVLNIRYEETFVSISA